MKKFPNIENRILPAGLMFFLLLLWEGIVQILAIPPYILPAPSAVITELAEEKYILLHHAETTLAEAAAGFFIAIIFAVFLASLMNRYDLLKKMLYPILVTSQTVPIIALAPLFMIWMGFGPFPKIIIVILVCFFPIAINVSEGLSTVDRDLINLLKVMKASDWQIFTKVQMPATMPAFFAGLKIAATYSIMGAVIAEWIGAESGLGIYMTRAMNSYRVEALFADILIIVVLSIGLFHTIEWIGKKLIPWNK